MGKEVSNMLKPQAFANAATVVIAVFYIACAFISYVAGDFVFGLANSWIHTLNLEAVRMPAQLSLGTLLYGLVSISILTWLTAYAFVALYNRFAEK